MDSVVLVSQPTGFEISNTLLVVVSLLIPAVVFLVGLFRDESDAGGPIAAMVDYSPAKFGRALGLQAIIFAILAFIVNIMYLLFTVLFNGLISPSIEVVGAVSGVSIIAMVLIIFLMIYSLSDTKPRGPTETVKEEVDVMILHQRNEELRDELLDKKQEVSDLVSNFKRLQIALNRNDDFPDSDQELLDTLLDRSSREDSAESTESDVEREKEVE